MLRYCGLKADQIAVIPNGIAQDEFDVISQADIDDFRVRYGLTGKRLLLFVGRIVKEKGVDLLIKAYNLLGDRDLMLLIVGPKNDTAYYLELIDCVAAHDLGSGSKTVCA